jgi:hypothetical protein
MSTVTTQVVDPQHMSPSARAAFIDELYVSHCTVFDGVSRDQFAAYVVESPADYTRILVLRDAHGQVRAYCAVHGFVQMHLGQRMLIIRMEIAAEKAWRRRSFAGPFVTRTLIALTLRYAGLPRYLFACFVHPSAYVSICRHSAEVWPRPEAPTPPRMQALMHSLTRQFGLTVHDGIAEVGWIAKGDCSPKRIDPLAAYYLARNPGYVNGQGLMTVLPVNVPRLAQGMLGFGRHLWKRRAQRPSKLGARFSRKASTASA